MWRTWASRKFLFPQGRCAERSQPSTAPGKSRSRRWPLGSWQSLTLRRDSMRLGLTEQQPSLGGSLWATLKQHSRVALPY